MIEVEASFLLQKAHKTLHIVTEYYFDVSVLALLLINDQLIMLVMPEILPVLSVLVQEVLWMADLKY
jgi:hypothetical protein